MIACKQCERTFHTPEARKNHVRAVHKPFDCGLCVAGPFSSDGLLAHAKEKHRKKFWKLFFGCRACDFYTADEEQFRAHHHASAVHRCCAACDEPYWDLPVMNSLVLYKRGTHSLSRCEECGRYTLDYHKSLSAAAAESPEPCAPSESPNFNVVDDLETTVGEDC